MTGGDGTMSVHAPASVVIPTLNEIAHIGGLIDHLLSEPVATVAEILVADGGSRDGTRELVQARARRDPRIRLVDNPDRIQASGVNRAVAVADPASRTIVRVDAHAGYPPAFVGRLLTAMADSGADSVVVRMDTVGTTCLQRAIAAASNSPVGTGGSAHRMGRTSGFIDHGHHAAMRRTIFDHTGGYDPDFEANEDAELDVRIRAAGGRIWLAADIALTYVPRATLGALARQYHRYGSGRARTLLKHGETLRLRQRLPTVALIGVLAGLLLSPISLWALLLPLGYFGLIGAAAIALALRGRSACLMLAMPAVATMHFAWAIGFLTRYFVQMRIFRNRNVRSGVKRRHLPARNKDFV
jgi:succinoglycan biosynthesis protein ExoA